MEVSKNHLYNLIYIIYEVSASKVPSTKFCEGFWDFVALSFPTGPPFHETSTNSPECPRAFHRSTMSCLEVKKIQQPQHQAPKDRKFKIEGCKVLKSLREALKGLSLLYNWKYSLPMCCFLVPRFIAVTTR